MAHVARRREMQIWPKSLVSDVSLLVSERELEGKLKKNKCVYIVMVWTVYSIQIGVAFIFEHSNGPLLTQKRAVISSGTTAFFMKNILPFVVN